MNTTLSISPEGVFEAGGTIHRIPADLSRRCVLSYRVLTEPLQVIPRLKPPDSDQLIKTRRYLLWRAAVCLIPSFGATDPAVLTLPQLHILHDWIARHRVSLTA